jgi:transposase-like protein
MVQSAIVQTKDQSAINWTKARRTRVETTVPSAVVQTKVRSTIDEANV